MKKIIFALLVLPAICQAQTVKIEAESFQTMSGIVVEQTGDVGGGNLVGWIDLNDFVQYSNPYQGKYILSMRVATIFNGAAVRVTNNSFSRVINIPNSQTWTNWITISDTVTLTGGYIRFTSITTHGWDFNWFTLTPVGAVSDVFFLQADSANIYFPNSFEVRAVVPTDVVSVKWFTRDGSASAIYGTDSLIARFAPLITRGQSEILFTATHRDGRTTNRSVVVNLQYNPWRVHRRVHLGELGDLVIMANGEHIFSGPCRCSESLLGTNPFPDFKPSNAPVIWLNLDTAGTIDTSRLLQGVKGAFKNFDVQFTTDRKTITTSAPVQEIALTKNNEWYGNTTEAGFSYVGLFGMAKAFVFTKLLQYNIDRIIYTTIHEIGHTLGLKHQSVWSADCKLLNAYNTGTTESAPWMGYVSPGKKGFWTTGTSSWTCNHIQNDSLVMANYIKTLK